MKQNNVTERQEIVQLWIKVFTEPDKDVNEKWVSCNRWVDRANNTITFLKFPSERINSNQFKVAAEELKIKNKTINGNIYYAIKPKQSLKSLMSFYKFGGYGSVPKTFSDVLGHIWASCMDSANVLDEYFNGNENANLDLLNKISVRLETAIIDLKTASDYLSKDLSNE